QEFELLIIARRRLPAHHSLFVHVRTVSQRTVQRFPVRKPVAGSGLQGVQIRAHMEVYGLGASGLGASGLGASAGAFALAFFWMVRTRSACAICLTVTLISGRAITLSNCAMAS